MKALFFIIILISFCTLSCKDKNPVVPENDKIKWGQITGNFAYLEGNVLYLLNSESKSVTSLGATNLTNLKWNKTAGKITGISFINDSTYSLEGIDLDGNHSILNSSLITKYYDWLPDGRMVTFSTEGNLLIDDVVLLNQKFDPVFGMACSPNGEKIVISTDNILENYLLEIDINSLDQSVIERNSNLFDPNFFQLLYSLDSEKVFYVKKTTVWSDNGFHTAYHIWMTPNTILAGGKYPNRWNALHKILYQRTGWDERILGIHSIDI